MTRSAEGARRWVRTLVGFTADLVIYTGVGLVLWLAIPAIVLGWQPIMISSGSMSPAVEPGDVLLIEQAVPADGEWFVPGTIITYEDTRPAADGAPAETRLVTHRVNNINADGAYVTRGDANATVDRRPVETDQVVGAARLLLPWIGLPIHWARQGQFIELATFVLAMIAVFLASRLEDEEELDRLERARRNEEERARRHRSGLAPLTLGARASLASRAGAASRRPRPTLDDEEAVQLPRRRAGLPPVGALLVVLALALGGFVPAAQAAFSDDTTNTGNSFTTAPGAQEPGDNDFVFPNFQGEPLVTGGGGAGDTFAFDFDFDHALRINGQAVARLAVERAANGVTRADVRFLADGQLLAEGTTDNFQVGPGRQDLDVPLLPAIDATFGPETVFTVEVTLIRLRMDVDGGSYLTITGP